MTAATTTGGIRRPRGPAFVQLVLSLAVALFLVAVTLTTRQPPPPAIAEFAPQAAEQIKEQPKEQASQFGSGSGPGDCPPGAACAAGEGGGSGAGGSATTTTIGAAPASTAPAPRRASMKRCVGDPPRQIEDPQSPPCIPFWDDSKGNGGATSPGVTADTITLTAPNHSFNGLYEALTKFFNNRFQLYGRQIKIVTNEGGAAGADTAKQQGAFASLTAYSNIPYFRTLAKHKIIGVYRTPEFSDSELAAFAPYIWGYPMSFTQMMSNLGAWTCQTLNGFKAKHAGRIDNLQLSDSDRSFAILMDLGTPDSTVKPDVLKSALEQCGAKVPLIDTYPRFDEDPIRIRNEIARAKASGVTTIFCLCVSTNLNGLQSQAQLQDYEPEWIITSYPQLVQDEGRSGPQMNRVFGLTFQPMDRLPEDHPWYWAVREAEPDNADAIIRSGNVESDDLHYRGFLMILSGLQMAGPNLTPETFREGLQKTKFPNPDHPIMAGRVGFHGDFSMTDDAGEFWNSETTNGPYGDPSDTSTFCYVHGGKRVSKANLTRGPHPLFVPPCDAGTKSVS